MKPNLRVFACGAAAALLLTAIGCLDTDRHGPTAPAVRDALVVTVSQDSLPADGVSTLVVTARIDPHSAQEYRTLVFSVNDGTIVEATADSPTTVERTVDVDGRAEVNLRSSRNVRIVEITVKVKDLPNVQTRATVSFTQADARETVAFLPLPATAPADTETRTPVTVEIAPSLPADRRMVSFTTSRGTFAQSGNSMHSVAANADHRARVDLQSPAAPGRTRITATVDGVTVETFMEFIPALPDTILVFPEKTRLAATGDADGSTPVQVSLRRSVGQITETLVSPRVVTVPGGTELPVIFSNIQPTTGQTTFTLTVGAITHRGDAEIQVRVEGAPAVGRALIQIVDP